MSKPLSPNNSRSFNVWTAPLLVITLLSLVFYADTALTFNSPENLFQVHENKLLEFELSEDNFEIEELEMAEGKWKYVVWIKAERPVLLVAKNTAQNLMTEKLENKDGLMFISETNKHIFFETPLLSNQIQHDGLTDFVNKARQINAGFRTALRVPNYNFEKWPAKTLVDTLMNNKMVLHGLYRKLFLNEDDLSDYYVKPGPINHMQSNQIIQTYKEFIVANMNDLIQNYTLKYLKPRRDVLRAAKTCTWAHASIEKILTYIKTKSTPILEKFVDSSVRIIFSKFYEENYFPLFNEDGVQNFLKTMVESDKNLMMETALKHFPAGLNNRINLGMAMYNNNSGWVAMGQQMISNVQNRYRDYANQYLQNAFNDAGKNPYIVSFIDQLDDQIRDLLATLNVEFKKNYSVQFEENEMVQFEAEAMKLIDVKDFFTNRMLQEVNHVLRVFVQNYVWYSVNLTMMPNLMFSMLGPVKTDSNFENGLLIADRYNLLAPIIDSSRMNFNFVPGVELFVENRRLVV